MKLDMKNGKIIFKDQEKEVFLEERSVDSTSRF